jgi:hypothetical protein
MKAVKGKVAEDRVEAFEKGAAAYAKKIVANFKDYEFVGFSQQFFFNRWI